MRTIDPFAPAPNGEIPVVPDAGYSQDFLDYVKLSQKSAGWDNVKAQWPGDDRAFNDSPLQPRWEPSPARDYGSMGFAEAWKAARHDLGSNAEFEWRNGKKFSTASAEERPDLAVNHRRTGAGPAVGQRQSETYNQAYDQRLPAQNLYAPIPQAVPQAAGMGFRYDRDATPLPSLPSSSDFIGNTGDMMDVMGGGSPIAALISLISKVRGAAPEPLTPQENLSKYGHHRGHLFR